MEEDTLLLGLFPGNSNLWEVESDTIYTSEFELYDYINGGAELYLNYGFKKLAKRVYRLKDQQEIKAEIFDLGDSRNAFGVFSNSKDEVNAEIGQGGQYVGGSLIFWQDRYFVSIFARKESQPVKETMMHMGTLISDAIGTTGELPAVLKILPKQDLDESSILYFHHPAWQNRYRFISNDNIFHIEENVHAILARYSRDQKNYVLLLIEYPMVKKARKGCTMGRKVLSKKFRFNNLIQDEQGLWMGYERKDRLLVFVFDIPTKRLAAEVLEKAVQNYSQTVP